METETKAGLRALDANWRAFSGGKITIDEYHARQKQTWDVICAVPRVWGEVLRALLMEGAQS